MTGYTVHTGASKKFVDGWDRIFSDTSSDNKKSGTGKSGAKKATKKTEATAKSSGKKAPASKSKKQK
ncbi:MAG: hypothetical protein JNL58_07050 [Planctomyces sp.]|nr:hypothetical protein [Planctomyces sp.]